MAELERSRSGPLPGFATDATIDGELVTLDPRLLHILEVAAEEFPLRVIAFSGVAGRNTGTGNHPSGRGIDVLIFDETGRPMPNFNYGPSLPTYEEFAYTARRLQQELYPELDNLFRWGGFFIGGGADLMHFDVSGGGMVGGNWDAGFDEDRRTQIEAMVSFEDDKSWTRYTDGRMPTQKFSPTSYADINEYFGPSFYLYQRFGGSPTVVGMLQQYLKAGGYYDGQIDGEFGRGTHNAIVLLQQDTAMQIPRPRPDLPEVPSPTPVPLPRPRPDLMGPFTPEYPAPIPKRLPAESTSDLGVPRRQRSSANAQYGSTSSHSQEGQAVVANALQQRLASAYGLPLTAPRFGTNSARPRRSIPTSGFNVSPLAFNGFTPANQAVTQPFQVASKRAGSAAAGPRKKTPAVSFNNGAPLDTDTPDVWLKKRIRQVEAINAPPTPAPVVPRKTKTASPPPSDNDTAEEWVQRRYDQIAKKKALG